MQGTPRESYERTFSPKSFIKQPPRFRELCVESLWSLKYLQDHLTAKTVQLNTLTLRTTALWKGFYFKF